MLKKDIQIGGIYRAKVSGSKVKVQILRESPYGGWDAKNLTTNREVRIKTAARLTQLHPADLPKADLPKKQELTEDDLIVKSTSALYPTTES